MFLLYNVNGLDMKFCIAGTCMNSAVMFLEDSVRFIFLYASKSSVFGGVWVLGKTKGKKKYEQLGNACQKNLFLC